MTDHKFRLYPVKPPVPKGGFPVHEYAALFPAHDGRPEKELEADLKENGQADPIVLFRGEVLDGRRRQRCLIRLGVKPEYAEFRGDEAAAFAFAKSKNFHRRHESADSLAITAAKLVTRAPGRVKNPQAAGVTVEEAAKVAGVSPHRVERARRVAADGAKELQQAVAAGEVSLSKAYEIAGLPKGEQHEALKQTRDVPKAARRVKPKKAGSEAVDWVGGKKLLGQLARWVDSIPRAYPAEKDDPEWQAMHRNLAAFSKVVKAVQKRLTKTGGK